MCFVLRGNLLMVPWAGLIYRSALGDRSASFEVVRRAVKGELSASAAL